MTWLVAVVLRPFGALVFFFVARAIALALYRVIPNGPLKTVLYDKSIRKRAPWRFFLLFAVMFYGTVALVALYVYR